MPAHDSDAHHAPPRGASPALAAATPRSRWRVSVTLLCWLLLAGVLLRLGAVALAQLRAPFDLVYESPNLSSIELIRTGANPYGPGTYDDMPFVFTVYTPLYHLAVAALPAAQDNPFFTGRLVALLCMLGSAALFAALPRRADGSRAPTLLAAAAFLALWPVTSNAAFLKNDPLALLCSAAAVVLVARGSAAAARTRDADGGAARGPSRLLHAWLPALLCVLAAGAKQSYLAASLACALHLWFADRRRAVHFLGALALCGAAAATLATAGWGTGIWFCTLTALHQPMSTDTARAVIADVGRQPLACVLGIAAALTLGTSLVRERGRLLTASPLPLYVACAALAFAATIGKQGASTNYAFEIALAGALWLATWAARAPASEAPSRAFRGLRPLVGAALCVAIAADFALAGPADVSFVNDGIAARRIALGRDLRERCTRLAGPDAAVLNLFSFLHTFELRGDSGRQPAGLLSDPWLYSILWERGTLSPAPLVAALRRGAADIVLLPAALDPRQALPGPVGLVVASVLRNYRLAETADGYGFYVRPTR